MNSAVPVELPDKNSFKPAEVCEIVQIPVYVLRTWENEFKDLGVAKAGGGPRTYRRRDVELALRIKDLVFSEHLTLAGARRRLEQEHLLEPPVAEAEPDQETEAAPASLLAPVKATLQQVKTELRELLTQLGSRHASAMASAPGAEPGVVPVQETVSAAQQVPTLPGFESADEPAETAASANTAKEGTPSGVRAPERKSRRTARKG